MLLCAGIMGAQVGAMGDVFNVFTGMSEIYGILIGCGIAIAYTTFGGMKAVIITDIIQFLILAVGLPLVLVFGISQIGGISALISDLPAGHVNWIPSNLTLVAFISLFLILLLGETLVPPYVQRLLIGRNLKETAKGTYWSGLFSIPFFAVTGLIGLLAFKLDPSMESNLALPNAIKIILPVGLRGLVVAGVISIVMSSADSFLNSASVAFTNDIYKQWKTGKMSMSSELLCARMVNLITGILAIIVAINIPNILDILIFAYNFWAPVILAPLAGAILGFGRGPKSFFAGAICGITGTVVWKYGFHDLGGFDGLLIGVFTNLIGYTVMNWLEKRSLMES
jgi:SSS family solute:Na+ symporter